MTDAYWSYIVAKLLAPIKQIQKLESCKCASKHTLVTGPGEAI